MQGFDKLADMLTSSNRLDVLYGKLALSLEQYRRDVACARPREELTRERLIEHIAISSLNLWHEFSRAYFLSCAKSTVSISGLRIQAGVPGIKSETDALRLAILSKGITPVLPGWPRRSTDEPKWRRPRDLERACAGLMMSNLANVRAALSISPGVFDHLPVFRNFYAHRNGDTAVKALDVAKRYYGIAWCHHPTDALLTPATRRPQELMLDWLDAIQATAHYLCR